MWNWICWAPDMQGGNSTSVDNMLPQPLIGNSRFRVADTVASFTEHLLFLDSLVCKSLALEPRKGSRRNGREPHRLSSRDNTMDWAGRAACGVPGGRAGVVGGEIR